MQRYRGKQQNDQEIRDLFKKTGDVKGIFLSRMGMIKDKNDKGLTEAEEIKKRGLGYTEKLYQKRS